MAKKISTHEAKTHLSRVIREVLEGAEVVICRGDVPLVKIVQYQPSKSRKVKRFGVATSEPVYYTTDAFAPLEKDKDLDQWGL